MQNRIQRELENEQQYKNKFVRKNEIMRQRQDNYAETVMSP